MPRHPVLLFGHRGASALLPENTMAAFRQALEDGANALELDVRATRDGHLVVIHDADGRRIATVPAPVAATSLAELRGWDAGAGFADLAGRRSEAGRGHRVPELAEVLADLPAVPLSIDLKPPEPALADRLLELLAVHGAAERATVGSFHPAVVRRVRRLGHPGPTALTAGEVGAVFLLPWPLSLLARARVGGGPRAAMIPRCHRGIRLDGRRFVARCRRLGLRVDYWVVNDPDVARGLLDRGATGIVTDDPARLAPAVLRG